MCNAWLMHVFVCLVKDNTCMACKRNGTYARGHSYLMALRWLRVPHNGGIGTTKALRQQRSLCHRLRRPTRAGLGPHASRWPHRPALRRRMMKQRGGRCGRQRRCRRRRTARSRSGDPRRSACEFFVSPPWTASVSPPHPRPAAPLRQPLSPSPSPALLPWGAKTQWTYALLDNV